MYVYTFVMISVNQHYIMYPFKFVCVYWPKGYDIVPPSPSSASEIINSCFDLI